ncbi:MAG: histidine--tRNA ligase [Propionibacteriaceae bacterium]|jgi:histidyl-tRNA synthetase|nr:histidine--tRNA ligase [Propionibacteriaceae bacterium]
MAAISGFPEYLPAGRRVEQAAVALLESVFSLHGFSSIQTRSLEPLTELARKGDITKEVYVVRRIHADQSDRDELGLHYDLTIPFARYVLENAGHLSFPFRRYQIQPAWRGERPQEGRYREFWQADIDIVGDTNLAGHHDGEVIAVMLEACARLDQELGIGAVRMRLNHRQLIQGYYEGLGLTDPLSIIQVVDKLDKIGAAGVTEILDGQGITAEVIAKILRFASISSRADSIEQDLRALGVSNPRFDQGLTELMALFDQVNQQFPGQVLIDCQISRGLDYYTGAVFEVALVDNPQLGTIAAGGRYDSLASQGKRRYPGVGISFGLTRVLAPLIKRGHLQADRQVPSVVMVLVDDEPTRAQAEAVAKALRTNGIPCEVSPTAAKYGKQIQLADRRGIPFVWFGGLEGQVKNIRSGDQVAAQAEDWICPPELLQPQIIDATDLAS